MRLSQTLSNSPRYRSSVSTLQATSTRVRLCSVRIRDVYDSRSGLDKLLDAIRYLPSWSWPLIALGFVFVVGGVGFGIYIWRVRRKAARAREKYADAKPPASSDRQRWKRLLSAVPMLRKRRAPKHSGGPGSRPAANLSVQRPANSTRPPTAGSSKQGVGRKLFIK